MYNSNGLSEETFVYVSYFFAFKNKLIIVSIAVALTQFVFQVKSDLLSVSLPIVNIQRT